MQSGMVKPSHSKVENRPKKFKLAFLSAGYPLWLASVFFAFIIALLGFGLQRHRDLIMWDH